MTITLGLIAIVIAIVLMFFEGFKMPNGGKVTWWALSLAFWLISLVLVR